MSNAKILIVEDEAIVALEIKRILEKLNFEITDTATNYNSALNSVRLNKPDLILMDINLGNNKDGIETVKKIHSIEKIPVIYITAFADEETINRAIKTNPVSYLIKPFKRDDLKSNIMLGLYKNKQKNKEYKTNKIFHIGLNYYFDTKSNKLYYQELPIKLSIKETLLLKILIEAKGELVSFKELEYQIWPTTSVSSSTLRTLIYRLRSKLEHKLIETSPMFGCKLVLKN